VLLFYGTGSIQGFAKTLLLGVVVSMFTAVIVTRFLMNRFVNAGATNTSLYTKVNAEAEKEVEA
jgi:preprotein translocase subunit SecD